MTTRGSPSAVAATLARLDASSTWPRFAAEPSGPGWVRLDRRLADAAALDRWVDEELRATARGHADLAGALIAYRLAGALAELVVGTVVEQRCALALTPATVAVRFGAAARIDALAVAAPEVAMLDGDIAGGEPGAVVVPAVADLRRIAAAGLVDVFGPVADAVRARAPFGLRGMWGTLADHVAEAAVRRARDRGRGVGRAWDEAGALVDELARRQPLIVARPRRQEVAIGDRREPLVAKGTCCLIYKAAGGRPRGSGSGRPPAANALIASAACTSCPLRDEADRAARFAAYMAARHRAQR